MVLMCFALIVMLSISSGACWPFVYLLWKNAYSDPLLVFKLEGFCFLFFFFLMLSCINSLSVLDINSFTDLSFAKVFFHSVGSFTASSSLLLFAFNSTAAPLCRHFQVTAGEEGKLLSEL